jgi:hypothetical protein
VAKLDRQFPMFELLRRATAQGGRMFARAMGYGRILGFDAWTFSMLFAGFVVAGSFLLLFI